MNIEEVQGAALREVEEHGLFGRLDSPAEWNEALEGASAGEPILVKDPDDVRDDFYLVPLNPKNAMARRGVWVMLDVETLLMREASLLNDWKAAAFPDQDDVQRVSEDTMKLPDGTVTKFSAADLKPNMKNLVWKASVATILPYWPVKELRALHPVTGVSTPIYVTQEGVVFTSLNEIEQNEGAESSPAQREKPVEKNQEGGSGLTKLLGVASVALAASTAYLAMKSDPEGEDATPLVEEIADLKNQLEESEKSDSERVGDLEGKVEEMVEEIQRAEKDRDDWRRRFDDLKKGDDAMADLLRGKDAEIAAAKKESEQWKRSIGTVTRERDSWRKKYEDLLKQKGDTGEGGKGLSDAMRKRLQAERERLSAQIHHAPEGMDLRKITARLKEVEKLLGIKK